MIFPYLLIRFMAVVLPHLFTVRWLLIGIAAARVPIADVQLFRRILFNWRAVVVFFLLICLRFVSLPFQSLPVRAATTNIAIIADHGTIFHSIATTNVRHRTRATAQQDETAKRTLTNAQRRPAEMVASASTWWLNSNAFVPLATRAHYAR